MNTRWQPPPGFRGGWREDVPLARLTTWRMGGAAHGLLQPLDAAALALAWQTLPQGWPRLLLGGGSNLLLDDEGLHGVVLHTAKMDRMERVAETPDGVELRVEAGVDLRTLAHFARRHALSGAEFLVGIPGSVGGALRMNAGAYGGEMANLVVEAQLLDDHGLLQERRKDELGMGYRCCGVPEGWIFTQARLRLQRDDPERIRQRMRAFNRQRAASQPLAYPSAGSVFRNPPGGVAWRLIQQAGLRGLAIGAAQVAEKHCNFFINRGGASSRQMRQLIDLVQERVLQRCGVELQREVRIIAPNGVLA